MAGFRFASRTKGGILVPYRTMLDAEYGVDTFGDDPNLNLLSNYTQMQDLTATWVKSGGEVSQTAGGSNQALLLRNGVSLADATVMATLTVANDAGLALRVANTSNYYVATIYDASSTTTTNKVRLYKRVAGAFTQIGTDAAISFTRSTEHTFTFRAVGTSLIVEFDGVQVLSQTDSAHTAAGMLGVRANSSVNVFRQLSWR